MPRDRRLQGKIAFVLVVGVLVTPVACQQTPPKTSEATAVRVTEGQRSSALRGRIGVSHEWHSSWIDLDAVTSFTRGDKLRLRVAGTAHTIVLRLLPTGASADDPAGIDGDTIAVPKDRVVVVALQDDHANIEQISIHGGPNPWNRYPLGEDNGDPVLQTIQRVAP